MSLRVVSFSRGPVGPAIPQLVILAASSARQHDRKLLRPSWLRHMWMQLLVIVGHYGPAALRPRLAFREEPTFAVTFTVVVFF